jgi:hypothetical protein
MRKEGSQTWKRTVLNHVTKAQSLDIITGINNNDTCGAGLSKFVYESKNSIVQEHDNSQPLLIAKVKGMNGKLFCLYKKEEGMVGRMELKPIHDKKIEEGSIIFVAVALTDTEDTFAEIWSAEQIVTTGMVLPLRREAESSRKDYWHILDFDWNVFEDYRMTWPGIWK